LKHIKDVRTEHQSLAKENQKDIEYFSQDKEMAKTKRRELKMKEKTKESLMVEIEAIDSQLEPLQVQYLFVCLFVCMVFFLFVCGRWRGMRPQSKEKYIGKSAIKVPYGPINCKICTISLVKPDKVQA
jgi:hypothetical protein